MRTFETKVSRYFRLADGLAPGEVFIHDGTTGYDNFSVILASRHGRKVDELVSMNPEAVAEYLISDEDYAKIRNAHPAYVTANLMEILIGGAVQLDVDLQGGWVYDLRDGERPTSVAVSRSVGDLTSPESYVNRHIIWSPADLDGEALLLARIKKATALGIGVHDQSWSAQQSQYQIDQHMAFRLGLEAVFGPDSLLLDLAQLLRLAADWLDDLSMWAGLDEEILSDDLSKED